VSLMVVKSRPTALLLVLSMLQFVLPGCGGEKPTENGGKTPTPYEGQPINGSTDPSGVVKVSSESIKAGYRVEYDIAVADSLGKPIKGIDVSYCEAYGKSLIYVYDPMGRYVPALIYAAPSEIESAFGSLGSAPPLKSVSQSPMIIPLVIAVFIALAVITYATVSFILDWYEIESFYVTDIVESGKDYILYCKTWEEIADLIRARTLATLDLTSIIVSYATFGVSSMNQVAWGQAAEGIGTAAVEDLRNDLLAQAIQEFGVAMSEIENKKMAVKVYPFEDSQFASRFRNLWATYVIERDNPICEQAGNSIEGEVVDATTGSGLAGASVSLSGPTQLQKLTSPNGSYRFENLLSGSYMVAASKTDYISETREVELSGSPVQVNFALSPELSEGEFRIVLTWGADPPDMDSHLWVGDAYHVYWNNEGSQIGPPYAWLDIDDRTGYGPETITISALYGDIMYAVHNYSESPDIKESNAQVKVYSGDRLLRAYDIPTSGSGLWWYVFDLSQSGAITARDYITNTPPGSWHAASSLERSKEATRE
jgi:hypothetical protein